MIWLMPGFCWVCLFMTRQNADHEFFYKDHELPRSAEEYQPHDGGHSDPGHPHY